MVVEGLAGQGKTALARNAADWLIRTGAFAQAVWLSFDHWDSAKLALRKVDDILFGESRERTLVVWDGLDQVLPGGRSALSPRSWTELASLALALGQTGRIRLLVTTRQPGVLQRAGWEKLGVVQPLGGLGEEDALELALHVFQVRDFSSDTVRDLQQLLRLFGGHPACIRQALTSLQGSGHPSSSALASLARFWNGAMRDQLLVASGQARHSMAACLLQLGRAELPLLAHLAPFVGGAPEFMIHLVAGVEASDWQRWGPQVIRKLERAGLVGQEAVELPAWYVAAFLGGGEVPRGVLSRTVAVPYWRFHPALGPYLRCRQTDAHRAERNRRFTEEYLALGEYLLETEPQRPYEAQRIGCLELPNLQQCLAHCLAAGDAAASARAVRVVNRFLTVAGRGCESAGVLSAVRQTVGQAEERGVPADLSAWIALESLQAELLLDHGRGADAERVLLGLLAALQDREESDPQAQLALLTQLADCLKMQGRHEEAATAYRQALELIAQLDLEDRSVRHHRGKLHKELGAVLAKCHQMDEAQAHYAAAQEQFSALGHCASLAAVIMELGNLCRESSQFVVAERYYRDSLEVFREAGDRKGEGVALHRLGLCFQERGEARRTAEAVGYLSKAEEYFRQALVIALEEGDLAAAAACASQLGQLTESQGRLPDAESWFREAIRLDAERGDKWGLAADYHNLGRLLVRAVQALDAGLPTCAVGDLLTEAEALQQRAASWWEQANDPLRRKAHWELSKISAARGEDELAVVWREKIEAYLRQNLPADHHSQAEVPLSSD